MRINFLFGTLVLLSAFSCSGGKGDPMITRTQVTVKNYRTAGGSANSVTLEKTSAMCMYNMATGEKSVQQPISSGSNVSSYLFSFDKVTAGDMLATVYPADAPVAVSKDKLEFTIPTSQDGGETDIPFIGFREYKSSSPGSMSIERKAAIVLVTVQPGAFGITRAVLQGNGGEALAGTVSVTPKDETLTAEAKTVEVVFNTPLDCRKGAVKIPFFIAPVRLNTGISVVCTTDTGQEIKVETADEIALAAGARYDTDPASAGRQLIAVGSNKVYIFDEDPARKAGNYKSSVSWEWDATAAAATLGLAANRMDHMDDAKPKNDNKQLLITSSYSWALLLDIATKNVLWFATDVKNAHSAEILPDDKIVVACADGSVALFNKNQSNVVLDSSPLESAHAVVWMESTQRLYAVGASKMIIFRINGNKLVVDDEISSSGFVGGMHDMTAVDDHTLIIGGSKLAFFDILTKKFTAVTAFNGVAGFKSVNYNPYSKEFYFTYAWANFSEGDYDWSSHWIRYTDDINASFSPSIPACGVIRVEDINMYKVRIFSW